MSHRDPPITVKRPPFILECDEREIRNGPGYCKVCEKLIPKADGTPHRGRNTCDSRECRRKVEEAWRERARMFNNQSTVVYERDHGTCAKCGKECGYGGWEADHIKALCLLTDEERRDTYWWSADNVQTLCHACHVTKTRDDMAKLRELRRPASELFQEAAREP